MLFSKGAITVKYLTSLGFSLSSVDTDIVLAVSLFYTESYS